MKIGISLLRIPGNITPFKALRVLKHAPPVSQNTEIMTLIGQKCVR